MIGRAPERFYVAGGTLEPESPSYVERKADRQLLELTTSGEFCWVLTTRQMGKSSLMAKASQQLKAQGLRTANIDLSSIGHDRHSVTADQWYYGVAYAVLRRAKIRLELRDWWEERELMSPVQRLTEFFEDLVLAEVEEPVVIFFDEIDSTIGLDFSDDFFAGIRGCYNARASDSKWRRLSFVLLGVATPDELISDPARTPFNIGRQVDLKDFTLEEAHVLSHGLDEDGRQAQIMLRRIFHWTDGHPFLTQALCRLASQRRGEREAGGESFIDDLVEKELLSGRATRTEATANLQFVSKRLTRPSRDTRATLLTFLHIRQGKRIQDQPTSTVHRALKLSGVVKRNNGGNLKVRNRIYEMVFTARWAEEVMPDARNRGLIGATIIAAVVIPIFFCAVVLPRIYVRNLENASRDVEVAYQNYDRLKSIPFLSQRADHLLALFWERRGDRDHALLTRLWSLREKNDERSRRRAAQLIGSDYERLLMTFRHGGSVNAVALDPQGARALTGSADHTAKVWDTATGELKARPLLHEAPINSVTFSQGAGTRAATGSSDNTARVWDASTGEPLTPPLYHQDWVRTLAFSPDGHSLLTGSDDQTARVWDVRTGLPKTDFLFHRGVVSSVAFDASGSKLLTGSWDDTAQLWNAITGEKVTPALEHQDDVLAVTFLSETSVMTISADDVAQVWNAATGERQDLSTWKTKSASRSESREIEGLDVIVGSDDDVTRIWDTRTGERLMSPFEYHSKFRAAAFSPDGTHILTGSEDGTARLWKLSVSEFHSPLYHQGRVSSIAVSPDGKKLVTGSEDGTLRVWDGESGEARSQPFRHQSAVRSVASNLDGTRVLAATDDGVVRLWDVASAEPTFVFEHGAGVGAVAFSSDGSYVLTGSDDGTARVWDTNTGRLRVLPLRHQDVVNIVAFGHDDSVVLTGSWDGTARVWDLGTGEPITPPLVHEDSIRAGVFSPNGALVLTASDDGTARLWNVETGELSTSPLRHQSVVSSVAFSPDGRSVLTGSWDKTVRLWDTVSGEPLSPFLRLQDLIRAVAFSRDGKHFYCATDHWLTYYEATDIARPLAVWLLREKWIGSYWLPDRCVSCLRVVTIDTRYTVLTRALDFEIDAGPSLRGEPTDLLEKWQRRLALEIDEQGRISPKWPISNPVKDKRELGSLRE